jgi:Glycosyltransferase family 10 (fucosyltransferase) C-term/Fucosyltransferase, N-terminal
MPPSVLLATNVFGGDPLAHVSPQYRGFFFTERAQAARADAVVFHIPDWHPALLDDLAKYPGQLWVGWSQESKISYPRQADPAFIRRFDLVMGYERTADVWMHYCPRLSLWEAARAAAVTEKEATPAVMFQSAAYDASGRTAFAFELMKCLRVDSYGSVLRNRSLVADAGRATKLATIARYRFCLAFENSIAVDYVTEKIFDPLLAGSIPIYRGAANVADFVPENSYIDAGAFGSPKALAAYIYHLAQNPAEAAAYQRWRDRPLDADVARIAAVADENPWQRLLALIARARHGEPAGNRPPAGRPHYPSGWPRALTARWRRRAATAYHRLRGRRR